MKQSPRPQPSKTMSREFEIRFDAQAGRRAVVRIEMHQEVPDLHGICQVEPPTQEDLQVIADVFRVLSARRLEMSWK